MTTPSDTEEYFDLIYSNEPASYYYLILEIGSQHVKALWYHSTKNLVTGFVKYPFDGNIRNLIISHPSLASEFKEVIVSVQTSNYLVSPISLINGASPEIFKLSNAFDSENQVLRSTPVVNLKSEIIFPLSTHLENEIASSFRHVKIIPHIAPRIEGELNSLRTAVVGNALFANISDENIDIRAYSNKKLNLSNSYFQTGKEDIAYYLLYVSEVLNIDAEQTTLTLSGSIKIGDESWNLLSKYWKNITLIEPLSRIEISQKLSDNISAEYSYLTHSLLCAS